MMRLALTDENDGLKAYATELEGENETLRVSSRDSKLELQNSMSALDAALEVLAEISPPERQVIIEKKQVFDMEALDMITRLKKIWKDLLVLYLPEDKMPDIQAISEVDFILDQIEISVQIVSSHVDNKRESAVVA